MGVFELAVEFRHFGEAAGQRSLCPCPLDDAPDFVADHLHRLDVEVVVGSHRFVTNANDHAHGALLDYRHRDQLAAVARARPASRAWPRTRRNR
jgi:hypothetical protein